MSKTRRVADVAEGVVAELDVADAREVLVRIAHHGEGLHAGC